MSIAGLAMTSASDAIATFMTRFANSERVRGAMSNALDSRAAAVSSRRDAVRATSDASAVRACAEPTVLSVSACAMLGVDIWTSSCSGGCLGGRERNATGFGPHYADSQTHTAC